MASNQKSLEEMLTSEVDESEISALVGSLQQLERPVGEESRTVSAQQLVQLNHNQHNSPVNVHNQHNQHNSPVHRLQTKAVLMDGLTTNVPNVGNNPNNSSINSNININISNSLQQLVHNSNADHKLKLIINSSNSNNNNNVINNNSNSNNNTNTTISNNININNYNLNNNNNLNNKQLPQPLTTSAVSLPGALPASGYISQVTNTSNVGMNSVSSGVAANQILKSAIQVSALPNGSPTPLQQSLQAVNAAIRPPPHPSNSISLSAITPSLVITPNKNSGAGPKPGQTLLIATTKDGQPMIVQPQTNPLAQQNLNNSTNSGTTVSTDVTTGSVPTTSSVVTIASRNIVSSAGTPGQHHNLMQQLVSNHSNQIQFQLVTNVNPSRPQAPGVGVNIGPNLGQNPRTLAPRVVQLPPNVRLTQQLIRPGGAQGFAGQNTITLPSHMVRAGTIFVKTENGQVHMVNVAPPPTSQANSTGNLQGTTYRLQVPTTSAQTNTTVRNIGNQHIVVPMSMASALSNKSAVPQQQQQSPQVQVSQQLHISTQAANQQASATTPSQMSPNTAKKKCKNFLSTLIRLASDQPPNVANNVKNLIQGLIDDAIQPEDFTNQLQKELNSSPQPCLVPFLRKSLPYLRYSLMQRELTIEGVRAPPHGAVSLPPQSQNIPQIQIAQTPRPPLQSTVRLLTPVSGLMGGPATTVLTPLTQTGAQRMPAPQSTIRAPAPTTPSRSTSKSSSSKSRATASKEKKNNSFSSSLRDDDDINDVAAMGGVNLQEESQRILASNAEIVGQQIRSCKDEDFLYSTPLHKRINQIAGKHGLDDCSPEVVSLVSHAVQERLKTLVEKLGVIAEHRQEQLKNYSNLEVLQDVKGQVMFLQELDRIEKRKHEEQEREVLIKAAKSRSKADDPDHLAIKMRAKEMQRQEMEEIRQREANETALQAIGNPKKRLKTSFNSMTNPTSISNSFSSSSSNSGLNSSPFSSTSLKPMRRIKRVSLKDLHFLMEMEKETVRTPMLYRAYLK